MARRVRDLEDLDDLDDLGRRPGGGTSAACMGIGITNAGVTVLADAPGTELSANVSAAPSATRTEPVRRLPRR